MHQWLCLKVVEGMCSHSTSTVKFLTSPLQLYANHFPVLACIAHDILTIPGVGISVKHLFSSRKHTLSDTQTSLSAKSASKTVVAKEWLKRGFGEGVNYLDDIHTHC